MKIELKLTADELSYLSSVLAVSRKIDIKTFAQLKGDVKIITSIMVDVADKLDGKFDKISRKPSLFDSKKTYRSTLSYHEAYALCTYIQGVMNQETDTYRRLMARKIHDKLHPHFV